MKRMLKARFAIVSMCLASATVLAPAIGASAGNLVVDFVQPQSHANIPARQILYVVVQTRPGATCHGQIYGFRGGLGATLQQRRTGNGGLAMWAFRTDEVDGVLTATAHVWCSLEGDTGEAEVSFTVG